MIVVEGPDGSGKSTLVRELNDELGWPIAPRVVSAQAEGLVNLRHWTDDNLRLGFQEKIFDRHRIISDPIYRMVLPDKSMDPDLYHLQWLVGSVYEFYDLRPIIVYCIPSLETVQYNMQFGVDDNSVVAPHIEKIYYSYVARAAIDVAADRAILYNYDLISKGTMVDIVANRLQQRKSA